jgi:hypothetical protein
MNSFRIIDFCNGAMSTHFKYQSESIADQDIRVILSKEDYLKIQNQCSLLSTHQYSSPYTDCFHCFDEVHDDGLYENDVNFILILIPQGKLNQIHKQFKN